MVPHTLPVLAALPPVASGAPGPSATAGDDAAGAPDTFARVLDAAAADQAPATASRAGHPVDLRPQQARPAPTEARRQALPAGSTSASRATPAAAPPAATAVAAGSRPLAEASRAASIPNPVARDAVPDAATPLPPVEAAGIPGVPAPDGTTGTAPSTSDDPADLLAELHARHAPRVRTSFVDRPHDPPGQPTPVSPLTTTPPQADRSVKATRMPEHTDKAMAMTTPDRKQTMALAPTGSEEEALASSDLPSSTPTADPADRALPARADGDPLAAATTNTVRFPAAPAVDAAAPPQGVPPSVNTPSSTEPRTTVGSEPTGAAPLVADSPSGPAMPQGPAERTAWPSRGDAQAAPSRDGDRAVPADRPPASALPPSASPAEPAAAPSAFGQSGFVLPALVPHGTPAAPVAAPAAEARLAASPGSAEFGSQLGAQLSTFVREGIQHARLHLHPAELGPVTVRIQLDGQAAQVHLAADNAFTRQALEQSMPQLAGSLREAGLTLSGGGVFEQPRQRGDDAPGQGAHPPRPARRDEPVVETVLRPGVATVARRGVVDLVA